MNQVDKNMENDMETGIIGLNTNEAQHGGAPDKGWRRGWQNQAVPCWEYIVVLHHSTGGVATYGV